MNLRGPGDLEEPLGGAGRRWQPRDDRVTDRFVILQPQFGRERA